MVVWLFLLPLVSESRSGFAGVVLNLIFRISRHQNLVVGASPGLSRGYLLTTQNERDRKFEREQLIIKGLQKTTEVM